MSFPSFDDVNEKFNKLLLDYFNFGNIAFKFSTKDKLNLEIGASHACKSCNLNLDVQSKLKYNNVGFIAKFLSTNILTLECQVEDFPLKNSETHFSIINDFSIRYHQAVAKHFKKGKNYHIGADCQFITSIKQPIATIHTLFGYENYFIGGKVCVDTHEKFGNKPDVDFCIGYSVPDFTFHGSIKHKKSEFYEASIYQRLSDNLQCGIKVGWEKKSNNVNLGLCANIDLDEAKKTFVKFKTNNCQSLGMVYGFEFMKGVQIALCGEFSKSNVNFGISSTIEVD